MSFIATRLKTPSRGTGTRLFLDENAELLYAFQSGSITAYSIATHDFGSAAMGAHIYSASPDILRGCRPADQHSLNDCEETFSLVYSRT